MSRAGVVSKVSQVSGDVFCARTVVLGPEVAECSCGRDTLLRGRGKTSGVVQSEKRPEVLGSVVSGTCQGPGLGLGFGVFLFHSYFFLSTQILL